MNFEYSETVKTLQARLECFMQNHISPVERVYHQQLHDADNRFSTLPLLAALKEKAKAEGLWNLFISQEHQQYGGAGLANLEYAPLAEIMGRVLWSSEAFNCNAPDTGNMEVFMKYATPAQQDRWLKPLLAGEIRSAYAMTEPGVASSDATNVKCRIMRDGDDYIVNGRKWFITGVLHENCDIIIVMGKSDPDNPVRHKQQSQVLVPMDTPGVTVVRSLRTLGYDDAPLGHGEILFEDVRVPAENILLGEGRGFEIAQGRLGPGRIHHCMRLIGSAQRALELACERVNSRSTFGRKIGEHQSVRENIAKSFAEIEQARLLTLMTADKMDRVGNKEARDLIAATKVVVPEMAQRVIDRAIQMHGAGGLCDDWFMAEAYSYARWCRLADGPDEVHMMALGKQIIRRFTE